MTSVGTIDKLLLSKRNKPKRKHLAMTTLMNKFKDSFEASTGNRLDFRKDVYFENQYNLGPTFNYDFAEILVELTYDFFQQEIEENPESYPDFGGWDYCLSMEIERLRTTKAVDFINNFIDTLANHKK